MEGHRACGVTLENGETLHAGVVISSLDPKTSLLKLVGAQHLDTDHVKQLTRLDTRGSTARLVLTLESMPVFNGLSDRDWGERLLLCPDVDHAQRASRAMKYNQLPSELLMDVTLPSVNDPSIAPTDQHILSANIHYIPYEPEEGWGVCKEQLADRAINALNYVTPNLRDLMIDGDLLTPPEIEATLGSPGGHWGHMEWTMDQTAMVRGLSGVNTFETPIKHLFFCGASTHPGGGVTGIAGMNAAKHILAHHAEALRGETDGD